MKTAIIVFLAFASLRLFAGTIQTLIFSYNIFPKKDVYEKEYADENNLDEAVEIATDKPRYDVNAYKERIRKMKETMNEDGIFDWVDAPARDDITGTEIIGDDI